jgi:site-specific DNA-methyltransferase (adenine-specific)
MKFINDDCMNVMKDYPNGYFDLAIVDPPYGISEDGAKNHSRGLLAEPTKFTPKDWDKNSPDKSYFDELLRISKNQIIFGANHFISKIPYNSSCWIVWDKQNGTTDFADCELAWTSFKTAVRKYEFMWNGMLQGDMKNKQKRIHPTQKPIQLYDWILRNYAKKDYKIVDTHLGSGSIAIACHNFGVKEFVGIEIDKEYFDSSKERFEKDTIKTQDIKQTP